MNFIQSYTPFFSGQTDWEFWGDVHFTPGEAENEVILTGLFGFQDECYGDISIIGTFDEDAQTVSFPYEQLVSQNTRYKFYFSGFGYVLNEDKTNVVDSYDFTSEDALVLSIMDFDGQHALYVEGANDNSWDVLPIFGFFARDISSGQGLGWLGLTDSEWFYMAEPNATISFEYVTWPNDQEYEIVDYNGYCLLNIVPLGEDGYNAIQVGPLTQLAYGCPVMFVYEYGDYCALDTYTIGNKNYNNPSYIGDDIFYYLYEITNAGEEQGIYLNINTDEDGYLQSCDFNCQAWCSMDLAGSYWLGQCLPAHIELEGSGSTGISTVASEKVQDGRWFNLQGIEVNKDKLQKGNIYINNGKKVLVK